MSIFNSMEQKQNFLLLFFAFLLFSPPVSIAGADSNEYLIGSGDLLSITVFGEEELSLEKVRVASNGTISFPLLGEVSANGLTSKKLEQRLTGFLLDGYLKKPEVVVSILEYRLFYVYGEVKKPGGFNFVHGLTVQKAIALAGGFTPRASERKITLAHEGAGDATDKVKLEDPVLPGDVMFVGESIF